MKPSSSASNCVPSAIARSAAPVSKRPSTTRTNAITPRYWSYEESKISARGGASGSPDGRRDPLHDRVEHLIDVLARLRGDADDASGLAAEQLRHLARGAVRVGRGKVDLVDDRDDLELVLDREIGVRERLRLDPLRRVDDEHRALARLQRA